MKLLVLLTLISILFSCSIPTKNPKVDIDLNIGWLHGNCLAIKNDNLASNTKITVFDFEMENQLVPASVISVAQSGEDCYALLDDRINVNTLAGYSFYTVKSSRSIGVAIGFVDIGNPAALTFEYCTTTEGIYFSVEKNRFKIWDGYYYLGYESDPTCEE
ncbi:hypothetical protein [Teredinibacter waterburyi]|uniref:hypothetical protein n=1 Tax=Teredinibacter waterburyi TaxID=1500538 RepID=UPI00165EF27E|nr:hypothetical protein [Teredinibacter waterburyi]